MKLFVLDTETGGLDPSKNGLTQICAGVCEFTPDWSEFEVLDSYHTLIKPCPGLVYDQKALDLQHVTLEKLEADGVRIGKAFMGVQDVAESHFGQTKAATPYGQNVKFDIDFLSANAQRYNLKMPCNFVYRSIDQWFRLLQDLGVHTQYRANLDTILAHYGIEVPEEHRHTAKGDVIATAECIRSMMKDFHSLINAEWIVGSKSTD